MALSKTDLKRVISSVPVPDDEDVGKWVIEVARAVEAEVHKEIELQASAAIRSLEVLGYTYHGGEVWKPPLGTKPKWLEDEALIKQLVAALEECKYSTQERISSLSVSGMDKRRPIYFRGCVRELQRATDAITAGRAWLDGKP